MGGVGRDPFPGDGRVRACCGRVADLGSADAAQAAAYRASGTRAAGGRTRLPRRVLLGAAVGQEVAGGASPRVRRVRGTGMGPRHGAGGLRCGEGCDCGCGADGALSGGLVSVLEHAVRGRAARGDHGVRVPRAAAGLRTHGHGAQGAGVRQRHGRRPPQRGRHGHADPPVLPVQRALRVPGPGSATRTRATRRAASRTRSGSCDAT